MKKSRINKLSPKVNSTSFQNDVRDTLSPCTEYKTNDSMFKYIELHCNKQKSLRAAARCGTTELILQYLLLVEQLCRTTCRTTHTIYNSCLQPISLTDLLFSGFSFRASAEQTPLHHIYIPPFINE